MALGPLSTYHRSRSKPSFPALFVCFFLQVQGNMVQSGCVRFRAVTKKAPEDGTCLT